MKNATVIFMIIFGLMACTEKEATPSLNQAWKLTADNSIVWNFSGGEITQAFESATCNFAIGAYTFENDVITISNMTCEATGQPAAYYEGQLKVISIGQRFLTVEDEANNIFSFWNGKDLKRD